MNSNRILAPLGLLAFMAIAAPASPLTFTATLLHRADFTNSYGYGISGMTQVGVAEFGLEPHAMLWNGASANAVDLQPEGYSGTSALASTGDSHVGYGYGSATNDLEHALLWQGSAASVVDLNPAGFYNSYAVAVSANSQVGNGGTSTPKGNKTHALLWHGTAASAIDLHPIGFDGSFANGVSGPYQVGYGIYPTVGSGHSHALMWSGSAASMLDLHPAGFANSGATGVSGAYQVGFGASGDFTTWHALLWNGSAASVVDLNPEGFVKSYATAISAAGQVGFGVFPPTTGFLGHAMLWQGSAASVIDLHPYLSGLGIPFDGSIAYGIDDNGAIVGTALYYDHDGINRSYAVLWTPVPEPASCAQVVYGLVLSIIARRCRGK